MCNKLICKLLDRVIDGEKFNVEKSDYIDKFIFRKKVFALWILPNCEERDLLTSIRSIDDAIKLKKEVCRDQKGNVEKSG
jgi:hypothetical protein